jgi:integrase
VALASENLKRNRDFSELNKKHLQGDTEPRQGAQVASGILTVRTWGVRWLKRRELEGLRSVEDDWSRWRTHVLTAPWADRSLRKVTPSDARDWFASMCAKRSSNPTHKIRTKPLAAATVKHALMLVRAAFQAAVDEGLCSLNPFTGIRVRRSRFARTREPWTVLYPYERSILGILPKPERLIARFALGTALRPPGELWGLHLADIIDLDGADPHAVIRYSRSRSAGDGVGPTKSGKVRRVPLFGLGLQALREWLAFLPSYAPKNPRGLVFPKADGSPRAKGRLCRGWTRVARVLGRPIRFYDLRHSCATALLAGWVGPPWSLEELRVLLGHSSITMTERYAHFLDDARSREAARRHLTTTTNEETAERSGEVAMSENSGLVGSPGLEPGTYGLKDLTPPPEGGCASSGVAASDVTDDDDDGDEEGGSNPPSNGDVGDNFARVIDDAETLVRVLRMLGALRRVERVRVLAVLRAHFPGEWPAERVLLREDA